MGMIPITAAYALILLYTSPNVFVYGSSYSVLLLGIDDTVNPDVEYQFVITNPGTANANVKIEGADVSAHELLVPSGEMKEHTLYQINGMNSSGISNKSIHVTSTSRFNLQVFYKRGSDYVEGFLAISRKGLLGPRKIQDVYAYVATTFCAIGGFCQIGISTFRDVTDIDVKFPKKSEEIVFCRSTGYFRSLRDTRIHLKKYESVMFESASDLTGTHIYSFVPIAVFVATRNLTQGGVMAHMVEQLHPMSHWGTEYVVRPLGDNGYGDILKISTQWNNTLIKMKGFRDFVVTNRSHNVWRRLDKGMSSHVKASKPIQIVQITGLAYGSISDTPKPGMVVVPAIENGEKWFTGSCGKDVTREFHVGSGLFHESPDTIIAGVESTSDKHDIDYTQYRVEVIRGTAHVDNVYNISNTNKLRGIVKCNDTAVMALGLVHQDPIPASDATQNNDVLCREMVMGTTTFDPLISQNPRHPVKFESFKIMLLRLRTCSTFFIQFLQSLTSIENHVLVSITRKMMFIRKCEPDCEKAVNITGSSYNEVDFDCKTDMQMYWFSLVDTGKLCYGYGPVATRTGATDCVESLTITRALMTATPGKAIFNYDLETEEDCDYRKSEWRCEDKSDMCATYGTDICSKHVDYARNYCPKLCKLCSPDTYGRKFIAVLPKYETPKFLMYVSGYRAMPNIAVGTRTKLIGSESGLSESITKVYNITGLEKEKEIFVFADADVSVTILFGLTNIASYPVYPVDNFGTEYFLFFKDDNSSHCYFITEYSSIGVTQFKEELSDKKDRETFQVGLSITLSQHYSSLPYQPPGYFTSTKPFIIYCGRRLEGPFHQLLPTNTWGTQYYVPAFETNPSDFPFDISLFIMAGRDNTVVTIDGDFNAIHALSFGGDTEDQPITGSETYTVTATNPIGLGVVFSDDGTPAKTRYFHALPPSNGFLSTQVSTVPVGVLSQFDAFDDQIGSIKSYHVDGQPTSIQTDHTVPDTKFMRNVTTSNMYGIYVVQGGAGQYFSLSGQRKNVNYETSEKGDRNPFTVGVNSDPVFVFTTTRNGQPREFFISRKVFVVYCGTNAEEGQFHQLLPTNTWGIQYYVPAFEENPSNFPFDISLFIMAERDNTVVTIDGDFNAIHALSSGGDKKEQPITGSETYMVKATHPIGLGVVFSDDGTPEKPRYFHALPPYYGLLSTQVSTVPVGVLSQFDTFDDQIGNIKSYHVDGQPTSIQTNHTVPDSKFLPKVTTSSMYGIYVVKGGAGQYFSLSGQRKNFNYETLDYCHTSFPEVGDKRDNDCDGLKDEDTCYSGYGETSEDYDLDGDFSDDCCCMDSSNSVLGKPTEPACLEIHKPANQCWTICQLDCDWIDNLENYQKLTEAEKDALHAAFAEQQKKKLVIEANTLSASTSQKISAVDNRPSAASIGYVGIALFTIVFGTIFIMDINSLIRDILITARNLGEGAGRFWNFVRRR